MRLLVAGINWPPETFLKRLIDGLVGAGVDVTVGSADRPGDERSRVQWLRMPSWDARLPVRLLRLVCMGGRACLAGGGNLGTLARGATGINGLSHRLQVWNRLLPFAGRRWDVAYFPWNSAAIACLPAFDLGYPVVVSCRGTQISVAPHNPERAEMRDGLRQTFVRAAMIHCVSEATLKDARALGLDPAKARVIRPAVDLSQFQPLPRGRAVSRSLAVVTVGTLIWVKGQEWALHAVRSLVDQGVDLRLEIIGDGPDRQRVLYTIADLGLENRVTWFGRLPAAEVARRVKQADVFLLSSHSEGISNAALEAMACGVPVVTTDCGGMREAVTDGVEGFVVPVRDPVRMAAALQKLAGDHESRRRMGANARARVERDFDLKNQVKQWLGLLDTVVAHVG